MSDSTIKIAPKIQTTPEPDELSPQELDKVSAGTISNVMKTKNDTVKNTISNIH